MSAVRASLSRPGAGRKQRREQLGLYIWTAVVLAVGVAVVILCWHAKGGTTDPTDLAPSHRLSHTTVVLDSAILVFREGLETILVLAAIDASFPAGNQIYRAAGRRGQRAGARAPASHLVRG